MCGADALWKPLSPCSSDLTCTAAASTKDLISVCACAETETSSCQITATEAPAKSSFLLLGER